MIGFCGLGRMGWPMASNIARAGLEVVAWTPTAGKADRWAAAENKASVAGTPARVAELAETIVVMVGDGRQVMDVVFGHDGLVHGGKGRRLLVIMGTVGRETILAVREQLPENWVTIDAPVSGGVGRARDGTLTVMASGAASEVKCVQPVLEAVGATVVHVGELGQGQIFKLINNAIGMANVAAFAEALVFGDALGVDLRSLTAVLRSGSASSAMMELTAEAMITHNWTTHFQLEHMLKDIRLCLTEALRAGVPLPAVGHVQDLLVAARARGLGSCDFTAVLEAVEASAGHSITASAQQPTAG